jgi:hypothetical protein
MSPIVRSGTFDSVRFGELDNNGQTESFSDNVHLGQAYERYDKDDDTQVVLSTTHRHQLQLSCALAIQKLSRSHRSSMSLRQRNALSRL